jgi:hypothetical protein
MCPWLEVSDLVLPVAAHLIALPMLVAVAACVPRDYVTEADMPRLTWPRASQSEDRLLILRAAGVKLWIVVFAHSVWKRALLKDDTRAMRLL